MRNAILLLALATLLTSCGVKSDLTRPDGQPDKKERPDPSRPPSPLGR